MNRLKATAWLLIFALFFPIPCAAVEEEEERLSVTVSIFDSAEYEYLLGNVSLTCPADSTVADLMEILVNYALIDGYTAEETALLSVTTAGNTLTDDDYGNWVVEVNDLAVLLSQPLHSGDEIAISYFSAKAEPEPSLPDDDTVKTTVPAPAVSDPNWNSQHASALSEALSWLKQQSSLPEAIIALGSAGIAVEHKTITGLVRSISDGWHSCKELSCYIIAAGHCNMHASNVNTVDLLSALLSYPDTTREEAAWSLLALDCNQYESTEDDLNGRDAALNYLLAAAQEDGGISPAPEEDSDPYLTALFITAASGYRNDPNINEAVENALSYLSAKQRKHGGFEDENGLSFPALCLAIIALDSCGLSTDDSRFVKNGAAMTDALLKFQNPDGGFTMVIDEPSSPEATFLGSMALLSMKSHGNPFLLRAKVTGTGSIHVSIQQQPPSLPTMGEPTEPPLTLKPVILGGGIAVGLIFVAAVILILKKAKRYSR